MSQFLSCDWGTTAFRLRLIETEGIQVIWEESTKQGIAETYQLWKQSGRSEEARLPFYLQIIAEHIKAIEQKKGTSLKHLPLVVSGMASSTIGMIDLPYKHLPVFTDGSNLTIHTVASTEEFGNKTIIISGLRTEDDVMRGEETKLVGCASSAKNNEPHVYIFPGTHSKHVEVLNGEATAFKTYMTGEFFELLSRKSVLSVSVKEGGDLQVRQNKESFEKGVSDSQQSNLLHNSFLVRTNDVFKKLSPEENFYYLSGLLVGTELNKVANAEANITVVGNAVLNDQYMHALKVLGFPKTGKELRCKDADEALIIGQAEVLKRFSVFS